MSGYIKQKKVLGHSFKLSLGLGLGLWLLTANGFNTETDAQINGNSISDSLLSKSLNYEDNPKLTSQRQLFRQAEQAFKSRRYTQFNRLRNQLADYPLYP
ncbi:MAG: hypothetical protein OQL06_07695, partial [Gammaproteobacteria bacterium]|nr:hypothetical protein [Gammaproteobacteria bacterium]